MAVSTNNKRISDAVYRSGFARAPARAYMRAMGLTDEDLNKPIVAVGSAWNEATPCNIHLTRLAGWVKQGVKAANGTAREFATIAVTDCFPLADSRPNIHPNSLTVCDHSGTRADNDYGFGR